MKTLKYLVLPLALAAAMPAFATNCEDVQRDWNNQNWRIDHNGRRIEILRGEINSGQADLDARLTPIRQATERALVNSDRNSEADLQALSAINTSIQFIDESILKLNGREKMVDGVAELIEQMPDMPLADLLTDFSQRARLRSDDRDFLAQLSNEIRGMEQTLKGWKAAENEMVMNFLRQRTEIVSQVRRSLITSRDKFQSDIERLNNGHADDQKNYSNALADEQAAQAALAGKRAEIASLTAANAACAAQRAQDEIAKGECNARTPRPTLAERRGFGT